MQKVALTFLSALAAAGCAADSNSVTVGNSNPLGAVAGLVWDAAGESPLPGVAVQIVTPAGQLSATTDMDGRFIIGKVPSGAFIISFAIDGYAKVTFMGALAGAVGNFPVANPTATVGPIGLIKTDGTFNVRVVDQDGAPANGIKASARAQVRYIDFSTGQGVPKGFLDVTATSGADGLLMFSGLPSIDVLTNYSQLVTSASVDQLNVEIQPVKVMGVEAYSFLGGTFGFRLAHLPQLAPVIVLAGPDTVLSILDSNIDYLRGQSGNGSAFSAPVGTLLGPSDKITIAFSEAINGSTVRAQYFMEDGTAAPITASAVPSTNLLTITPMQSLGAGLRYNLGLHVDALTMAAAQATRKEINLTVPIFVKTTGSPALKVVASSVKADDAISFTFQLSEPIGIGLGSTAAISCVVFYDNVNFDNDPMSVWPGEWNNGVGLQCPPGPFNSVNIDVTKMTPLENTSPGMPITGYSSRWKVIFDTTDTMGASGGCKPGVLKQTMAMPGPCIPPAAGTSAHLVFSHVNGQNTVKRADGTPVPDDNKLLVTIPMPPM
jgi:hypothetical protein